jgi:hypothetical protein
MITFRPGFLASTILLSLLPVCTYATGLFGPGNTVQAFYYNGVFASPEGEIPVGGSSSDPTLLTGPVNYLEGAADGSTIAILNTQIAITNLLPNAPFCNLNTPGTACVDMIDGFDFKFTGENILGVSVNSGTPAGFQPVSGTFQGNTHLGLQLISPNEVRVDVTGDLPLVNDTLILDLSFTSSTSIPEPSTLPLVCAALGLCLLMKLR